jgi:hypothetical protein
MQAIEWTTSEVVVTSSKLTIMVESPASRYFGASNGTADKGSFLHFFASSLAAVMV